MPPSRTAWFFCAVCCASWLAIGAAAPMAAASPAPAAMLELSSPRFCAVRWPAACADLMYWLFESSSPVRREATLSSSGIHFPFASHAISQTPLCVLTSEQASEEPALVLLQPFRVLTQALAVNVI